LLLIIGWAVNPHMNKLQDRTKAFLKRPIPKNMEYMPDSLAERFLVQYAQDGHLTLEAETAEILAIMVNDTESNAPEQYKPGEREYMAESHQILAEILQEEIQRPSWPAPHLLSSPPNKKPWWRFW
jgi:hypothetical protein